MTYVVSRWEMSHPSSEGIEDYLNEMADDGYRVKSTVVTGNTVTIIMERKPSKAVPYWVKEARAMVQADHG